MPETGPSFEQWSRATPGSAEDSRDFNADEARRAAEAVRQPETADATRERTLQTARELGLTPDTCVAVRRSPKKGELEGPIELDWLVSSEQAANPGMIVVEKPDPNDPNQRLTKKVNPNRLAADQPTFEPGEYNLPSLTEPGRMLTWELRKGLTPTHYVLTSREGGVMAVSGSELRLKLNFAAAEAASHQPANPAGSQGIINSVPWE